MIDIKKLQSRYAILEFDGPYKFLSNFYPAKFKDCTGAEWPTSEHYFQAMKTEDLDEREMIRNASTPGKAKYLGRNVKLREDWNKIKIEVMKNAISYKFRQNPDLYQKLLDTEDRYIVEGNYWHDNIWGDCYCEKCRNIRGKNYLGRLLMGLRNKL